MAEFSVGHFVKCLGKVKEQGINVFPIVKALVEFSNSTGFHMIGEHEIRVRDWPIVRGSVLYPFYV